MLCTLIVCTPHVVLAVLLLHHHMTTNRFNLEPTPAGCVAGDHVVSEETEDPQVLRVLRLQRHNISFQARIVHNSVILIYYSYSKHSCAMVVLLPLLLLLLLDRGGYNSNKGRTRTPSPAPGSVIPHILMCTLFLTPLLALAQTVVGLGRRGAGATRTHSIACLSSISRWRNNALATG